MSRQKTNFPGMMVPGRSAGFFFFFLVIVYNDHALSGKNNILFLKRDGQRGRDYLPL